MRHFILIFSVVLAFAAQAAYAQQASRNLSGKIVSADRKPMGGTVVQLYGNYDKALITDANGAFTFDVPANKVIYLSVRHKKETNIIKVKPTDKTVEVEWNKATAAASLTNLEEIKQKKL